MEAVPAGEVVQPGPGRDLRGAGAVVVAAAIVEVPAQGRRDEAAGVEPGGEGGRVERRQRRTPARALGRNLERLGAAELADRGAEGAIRGQRRGALRDRQGLGRRQQAFAPGAVDEQALLRAVAEHALVVDRSALDGLAHAELPRAARSPRPRSARASAGSARRAGSACRRAHGRGCCRRPRPRARADERRRRRRASVLAPRPVRRCRRRRRSPRPASPPPVSARRRTCRRAGRCAAGGHARPRRRPSRLRTRRRAARSPRSSVSAAAEPAARTSRRVGPRRAGLIAAPGPTRLRRSAPAPGSTAGSPRPARAPCRAETRTAARAPAGRGSAAPRAGPRAVGTGAGRR